MKMMCSLLVAMAAATALGQPVITAVGSGVPLSATPGTSGAIYVGGTSASGQAGRWTLNAGVLSFQSAGVGTSAGYISSDGRYLAITVPNTTPQYFGNTAAGVTPPFSTTPTLVPAAIATTEIRSAIFDADTSLFQNVAVLPVTPSLMVYGSGSSGSTSGTFISPHNASRNGRFVVGQAYISSYNNAAGATISSSTFQWRPYVFDSLANGGAGATIVLPTPFRSSSNTWRRRTGAAYGISDDGQVICGYQEHNSSTLASANPDGARPVVWRFNGGTNEYEMTFLPNGVDANGFFYTASATAGSMHMNAAGTMIVGRALDNTGAGFIGKWTWDAGTSTWTGPEFIGSGLVNPASWLPQSVTSCGVPPTISATGMSDDGSVIVGSAVYSTCGSFMSGGWIWSSETGMVDWYDYLVSENVAGITENYGPIGDNGDPTRGLPKLGYPLSVSMDGNNIVGFQGGTQRIPFASSWILQMTGGTPCTGAAVTLNPNAVVNYSACTSSIILNVGGSGTLPLTYQWYKDGVPLADGVSPTGSNITGSGSAQLRINQPLSTSDVGTYHATIVGSCGSLVTSTNSVVQLDPAFPVATNDVCSTAQAVSMGTNVLGAGQSPCGAWVTENGGFTSCDPTFVSKADRWFVFTPSTTQAYRLETCGSTYDTVISIYENCNGAELACNNDYATGPSTSCSSNRSRIASYTMNENQPYYIRIAAPAAAFLSDSNLMNLSIMAAPAAAPNDDCATPAVANVGANNFSTIEATNSNTVSCSTALSRDVYFTFTAPITGRATFKTCPGTSYNTVLSVQDGCFGAELGCNDNANISGCSSQSIVSNVRMLAGQTATIRIGGSTTTQFGAGVLTVDFFCAGDIDGDLDSDSDDITLFFAGWDSGNAAVGDMDGDQDTDSDDVVIFFGSFDSGC